jgi:zinc transport system permease protein
MSLWHWLMGLLPFEWARYAFMHNALLAVLLVSLLFGLLGSMVVNQQMAFFSDAVGHAALTGIALGALLGMGDPLWSMAGFSLLLALGITLLRRRSGAPPDAVISLLMSFAVALGVVILSRQGGFTRYTQYLIGDVLSVTPAGLALLLVLLLAVLLFWLLLFNRMLLLSLNPSLARSRRVPVFLLESVFSALVALVVTVSIQWVGLLVISSLLVLPAAASRNVSGNVSKYLMLSVLISLTSGVAGLIFSYYWATATGATIVIFAMGFYLVTLVWEKK